MDPSILETVVIVVRQRNFLFECAVEEREQAHLDHDLEPVANPNGQFAVPHELEQRASQLETQSVRENPARGYIVSEGKAAGDG